MIFSQQQSLPISTKCQGIISKGVCKQSASFEKQISAYVYLGCKAKYGRIVLRGASSLLRPPFRARSATLVCGITLVYCLRGLTNHSSWCSRRIIKFCNGASYNPMPAQKKIRQKRATLMQRYSMPFLLRILTLTKRPMSMNRRKMMLQETMISVKPSFLFLVVSCAKVCHIQDNNTFVYHLH